MTRITYISIVVCVLFAMVSAPGSVMALGGHDSISCSGCHSIHDAKDSIIFAVKANDKELNARTKKPFDSITGLCIGCHQSPEKGGMGIKPISSHVSHPYGLEKVSSKVARVPDNLLRNGKFGCVGCHDPHPSNPNYRYLRVSTSNGSNMEKFCAVCHPMKADPKAASADANIFDSMDESRYKAPGKTKLTQK